MARNERDPKCELIWRGHLERQKASGQSVRGYCLTHRLVETAFHYWRRTIAERDREARPANSVPAFVPVTVVDRPPAADTPIDIRLSGGHQVRVRAECGSGNCHPTRTTGASSRPWPPTPPSPSAPSSSPYRVLAKPNWPVRAE
jgi:hypothetical protein